ncbi:MAG: PKD domain-containing protein, partial [Sulfitobacter sp.]|nr:PKD domain-containing protein [Sulfitobacter sp.]
MKSRKSLPSFQGLLIGLLIFLLSFAVMLNTAAAADFIVAIDDSSNIWSADSNGDGTFGTWGQIDYLAKGNYSRGIAVNDFDNDGDMDFVAGRGVSTVGYYYLFLNDGSNTFTKTAMVGTQSNANSYAMDMATGDFNNDGNMDFAANGNHNTTGIYLGDGKGNFTKTELNWGHYGRGMDTADFNHDGHTDIVRGRYSSGYIDVYWGDGSGTFPTSTYLGDVGSDPYGVVAGDFDNDGHPDVIANSGSNGDTYFAKGNGDGTFLAPVYEASLDLNNHGAFDAFDYNGDGNLDVLIANYSGRTVYYYPGNGNGTFGAAVTIGTTAGYCMAVSAPPSGPPVNRPLALMAPPAATIDKATSVDFDGSGSSDVDGAIASWDWTFGDGGTDNVENPDAYTYAAEGIYPANLTVTDNDGKSDLAVAKVVVEGDAPVVDNTDVTFGEADASYGAWSLVLDGADYATDTEGIVSYLWDLGDGLTENFEDADAAGWETYAGTWAIEDVAPLDGVYSYRQTNITLDRTWTLFDKHFDTDLIITADVHLVAGSGEEAHVLFRAKDKDNNYEFILRGRGYDDVLLYRRVNGGATNVFEYDLPDAIFGTNYIDIGNSYAIKIVCTGSLIQFYLDDKFLFAYPDSTFSSGRVGLSTYDTDAIFDNLTVLAVAAGQNAAHQFTAGTYDVLLTATDAAGQQDRKLIPMTIEAGGPPSADAGESYPVDETVASEGGWTVNLDGTGSTDDVEIQHYVWDFGTDTFDGTQINEGKWLCNGNVSQDDELTVAHPGSGWNQQYCFSKDIYTRAPGMAFEAKVMLDDHYTMVGFKNTSSSGHYNQYPYAMYLYYGNIHIYEDGSNRGDTGFNMSYDTWYDIRIELKETQGARYYYRLSGSPDWILVYDSNHSAATEFKRGFDVGRGTFLMDDVREIAAGPTLSYRVYGPPGSHSVALTVTDRVGQSDTDTATIATTGITFPTANGGADWNLDESNASDGYWTVDFTGTATDTEGVYLVEWDWSYDGVTFVPSGDTGTTASHTWDAPGTYTVAMRVTDHALQTHVDVVQVVINQGTPPTAAAGGPYAVDEITGNAFQGAWSVTLDALNPAPGSTDDTGIARYNWDLGTETFDGTQFLGGKWYTNGGISQDDAVAVTGANSWSNRYIVTKGTVPNEAGQVFQTRFMADTSGQCMFGFKNDSTTNFHYNQFPYEFYIYNTNIYIYENSSSRGYTGYNISYDTWYDFKIELKTTGAVYSYKLTTAADWTVVYTSGYTTTDTILRKGLVVYNNTYYLDDFIETTGGPMPTVYLSGLGSHTVHLTVYDQAGQSDTDTSSVTTAGNAAPVADAGGDKSGDETTAFEGTWTLDFDASGSTDDSGIYLYEWDWDSDGTYDATGVSA